MLRYQNDNCGSVYLALEYKSKLERLVYSRESNNRDKRGSFNRKRKKSHFLAIAFQVIVKFRF